MTDTAPISVQYMNELQDHLAAQRFLYGRGVLAKIDKVVAVLLAAYGVYAVWAAGVQWWTIIWFPLAVAEWFDWLSLTRWRARLEFRRNPKFREEYNLTFTRDHVHFKTASIDSVLQWTHYNCVHEPPGMFLLMDGKGLYTLIPHRAFKTEADIQALRVLLAETIPAAPVRR